MSDKILNLSFEDTGHDWFHVVENAGTDDGRAVFSGDDEDLCRLFAASPRLRDFCERLLGRLEAENAYAVNTHTMFDRDGSVRQELRQLLKDASASSGNTSDSPAPSSLNQP